MEINDKLSIKNWKPNALIYDYDTPSFNAYFIIEGQVDIFTPRGLKLNSIGPSEVFGALLRNVQMRLVDSNEQSARYAKDIEKLIKLAREQYEVSIAVTDKLTKIQKRIENDFFSDY